MTTWKTLDRRWGGADDTIAILEQIGQAREALAIPHLMSFGFVRNSRVRTQARSTILHLFSTIPIESLAVLDESLRQSWAHLEDWYGMTLDDIAGLGGSGDADQIYLALVSCHRSGYVRAEAVRSLSTCRSDLVVPFLLLRLLDWVGEVRSAAEAVLRSKLNVADADAFVQCLGLMGRLSTNSRYCPKHAQWIDDLLESPGCADSLRRGIRSQSRGVRRECYRIAAVNPAFPTKDIINQAIADVDVIVRRWAFLKCCKSLPDDNLTLLRKAARDPYGPIRRLAFEALLERDCKLEELRPFLVDRLLSIRRLCQSEMLEREGQLPAVLYRAAIDNPTANNVDIAIIGLAETGNKTDGELIAKFSASASPRVRRAVVRALHILSAEGHSPMLRRLLASDVPSVAREAARSLLLADVIRVDDLWAAALENPHRSVRSGVLRMIQTGGKWQQLKLYFEASSIGDPDLTACATALISRWVEKFNSTFTQVSPAEALVLIETMESVRSLLSPTVARDLEFILRTSLK